MRYRPRGHVAAQRFHQRLKKARTAADPIGQGRALQFYILTRIDLALPMQRKMIAVLTHQNVRQQPRPGPATRDRSARCFGLQDAIALRAAQLGTHVTYHHEAGGHVLQHLRDILT